MLDEEDSMNTPNGSNVSGDKISPENAYLQSQLASSDDGGNPFEKQPEGEIAMGSDEEDEDDDDGLALDLIERVQK